MDRRIVVWQHILSPELAPWQKLLFQWAMIAFPAYYWTFLVQRRIRADYAHSRRIRIEAARMRRQLFDYYGYPSMESISYHVREMPPGRHRLRT
jgi:hypothetical protein